LISSHNVEVIEALDSITYIFKDLNVKVLAERITDDIRAELTFFSTNGSGENTLLTTEANLLSTPTQTQIAKRLQNSETDVQNEWLDVMTYVAAITKRIKRRGEPLIPMGKKPEESKIEYQLEPILVKNQPTTIYSPGGYAKSYLAAYIACLVQFNVIGLTTKNVCWIPSAGNVLYLDWESSFHDHERRVWAIKRGLNIDSEDCFLYRFCEQPLVDDINNIAQIVHEKEISLVIVDSQMAASGYGFDPAQTSSQYYNALRHLRCTTLTLDHVSKSEWAKKKEADSIGPYGSVVKFNRSRSQFEIKKSQYAGDGFVELALVHRKNNEGRLLKPIGIRIDYFEDADGVLDEVTFSPCDISDNPELAKVETLKQRLLNALKPGPATIKDLVGLLDKDEAAIRMELNRKPNKGLFVKIDGKKWGLAKTK
jgi:hypothetical protein